jgi:hypothetical protein
MGLVAAAIVAVAGLTVTVFAVAGVRWSETQRKTEATGSQPAAKPEGNGKGERPEEDRPLPPEAVTLTVHHDQSAPTLVMVTRLSKGKAIRTKQLRAFTDEAVTWEQLPVGTYELRFETDGYEKTAKQAVKK